MITYYQVKFKRLYQNKSILSSISEKVDNYFYLGGRRAKVLGISKDGREKVVLSDGKASWFSSALKVISYATIVIPLILLAAKYVLRSTHQFKVIDIGKKLKKYEPQEIVFKLSSNDGQLKEIALPNEIIQHIFSFLSPPLLAYKPFVSIESVLQNIKCFSREIRNVALISRAFYSNSYNLAQIQSAKFCTFSVLKNH